MDTQQVLKLLLARMETMQVKADADREERKADQRKLKEMMMKMMDVSHKEMVAVIKPERDMETMACQEMEAHLEEKEPIPVDMKPEAAEE
jgi:predicted transposase YbfD/YdcC